MATIAENIDAMAALVARVKKQTHLQEATIMRIVDMNFALAQQSGAPSFTGGEEFPTEEQLEMFPENVIPFPESDAETAAALGIEPIEEN